MEEKVRSYIEQFQMLKQENFVVAGISGGADSVCLLLLLNEIRREIGFSLTAVHVEHGIRGEESGRDAAFAEQLCKDLGIPFVLCRVDVPLYREEKGLSMEEAARELRYDCLLRVCEETGADRIALGHHADDNAETVLFHLARGTGIRGMSGIRPVSERGTVTLIRPLLGVTRKEIEAWLLKRGQTFCTDSTNTDLTYSRNRLRERVIPEMEQINTQAVSHMLNTSEQLAEICDYLDETAWEAGQGVFNVSDTEGSAEVDILCAPFLAMHDVLKKHLTLQLIALAAGSRRDVTAGHVEEVIRLMTSQVGTQASLPYGITALKTYDSVVLRAKLPDVLPLAEQELLIPGETVTEDGIIFSAEIFDFSNFSQKIPQKSYTKWFDYDKIKHSVRLRGRHPGDYLTTDRNGGHKKLNRFFIDEKIPLVRRDRICLLADEDHIMWVVGHRISEEYKVTEQTKKVLCVKVELDTRDKSGGEDTDG